MFTTEQMQSLIDGGGVVVDRDGDKVEKVKVVTDTVTEDGEVTEGVRKEQIDSDVDTGEAGRDR